MTLKAHQVAEVCRLVETVTDDDALARAFDTSTATIAALRSLVERRKLRAKAAPLPKVEVIKNEHPAWSIEYCDRQHELEMKDGSARLLAAIVKALDAR